MRLLNKIWEHKTWLQAIFSLLLIIYLFGFYIDVGVFYNVILDISLGWYALSFLFGLLSIAVSVWRWKFILKYQGHKASFLYLTELYFIGTFYNRILPGSIGGDAIRAYKISQSDGGDIRSISTVPLERFTGLIALLIVGSFGLLVIHDLVNPELFYQLLYGLVFIFVSSVVLTSPRCTAVIMMAIKRKPLNRIISPKKVREFIEPIQDLRDHRFFIPTIFHSIVFIIISVFSLYFIALSLGAHLPLFYLAAILPIIQLVMILPLSIGGLGVREGLYVYFFTNVGISAEAAVAIGLAGVVLGYINAILGAVVNLKYNLR